MRSSSRRAKHGLLARRSCLSLSETLRKQRSTPENILDELLKREMLKTIPVNRVHADGRWKRFRKCLNHTTYHTGILTLSRPEARNCWGQDYADGFTRHLEDAAEDDEVSLRHPARRRGGRRLATQADLGRATTIHQCPAAM
jgi:hypothetical protein